MGIGALLLGIACLRIVSTYHVFSQTCDEPAHIAAGMEWLDRGTYTLEPMHPPLARIAAALGPFLAGAHLPESGDMWDIGNDILYERGDYGRVLSLARLGELPFFILAACVVWAWSRSLYGEAVGLISLFLFTLLPPILGHAGLATTDMAAAATCLAAFYALARWLDHGSAERSLVLGLTVGLAVLSKFSALLFLPTGALAILAGRWWSAKRTHADAPVVRQRRVAGLGLAALLACLVIWAGYRFSLSSWSHGESPPSYRTVDAVKGWRGGLFHLASSAAAIAPLPAPQFFAGLSDADVRLANGGDTYILGKVRGGKCWYFFFLALAVKSPLAFLILAGMGIAARLSLRGYGVDPRGLEPTLAAAAIVLATIPMDIHMGVRHVLVVYPLLSIAAGFGVGALWNNSSHRRWGRGAALLLTGWLLVSSVRAHPDYFPYFNELAGGHPERILIDSDLDWGQDLLRLAEALKARKVDKVALCYFGNADPENHNLPPFTELVPYQPTTGWIAISFFKLKGVWDGQAFAWLEAYQPVARVGRSILLYYIPKPPTTTSYKAPSVP